MIALEPSVLASIVQKNDEQQVRQIALETDYSSLDLIEATRRIACLLLLGWPGQDISEADFPNKTHTPYEQWLDKLKAERKTAKARKLISWAVTYRNHHAFYPIFLYNRDMWATRRYFDDVLHEKDAPPYLSIMNFNIFRQMLGISHTRLHEMSKDKFTAFTPLYNRLMSENLFQEWKERRKCPLRFYGGHTNTTIGLYDDLFKIKDTGIEQFNASAQGCFDIGGGFCTSEINRCLGGNFVSADINGPSIRAYDDELVIRMMDTKTGKAIIADDLSRNTFLDRQDKVAWHPFDVFKDSFPDMSSYAFISTGFITSAVRANRDMRMQVRKTGLGEIATSFHGIARIMEKVIQGKDVDFFSVQRASGRVYKYKTALLKWRRGRLVSLVTTDDTKHAQRWRDDALQKVYASIHPDNPFYDKYTMMQSV